MDMIIHKQQSSYGGVVPISGAKNSAIAIISCCLLTDDFVTITNVPRISDCFTMVNILKEMGHYVSFNKNTLSFKKTKAIENTISLPKDMNRIRGSYYIIGSLINFYNKIISINQGGCDLGSRPIDLHISSFEKLGINVTKENTNTFIYEKTKLTPNTIILRFPSVGATINTILASVLTIGTTTIINCAKEPEVVDVCHFLRKMGANIKGMGESRITIQGVESLKGTTYEIMPDRIEAGTYLAIGCLPNVNKLTVTNINSQYLPFFIPFLRKMGHKIIEKDNEITIEKTLSQVSYPISTGPYPLLSTDLGPIISVIMSLSINDSSLTETIFENRFSHLNEVNKLGGNFRLEGNTIIIKGNTTYHQGIVTSHDLRCSAALVISAIASGEEVVIRNIDYLFRGYENITEKLLNLGIFTSIIN